MKYSISSSSEQKQDTSVRESVKERMTRSIEAEYLQVVKHFTAWSRCDLFLFFQWKSEGDSSTER